MKSYQRVLLTMIVTIIVVLAVEIGLALAVMWWGVVNVGADHPHPQPIRWYLDNAMTNSVQEHARGLQAPAAAQVSAPKELRTTTACANSVTERRGSSRPRWARD